MVWLRSGTWEGSAKFDGSDGLILLFDGRSRIVKEVVSDFVKEWGTSTGSSRSAFCRVTSDLIRNCRLSTGFRVGEWYVVWNARLCAPGGAENGCSSCFVDRFDGGSWRWKRKFRCPAMSIPLGSVWCGRQRLQHHSFQGTTLLFTLLYFAYVALQTLPSRRDSATTSLSHCQFL